MKTCSFVPCAFSHVAEVLLALALSVCGAYGIAEEVLSGEMGKQYVLMLCDGFDKNREAFKQYTCRFMLVCGTTECPGQWWKRDSWDTQIDAVDQTAAGLLARDGKVFRYQLAAEKYRISSPSPSDGSGGRGENATTSSGTTAVSFASLGCFGFGKEDTLFDDEYVISDVEIGPQAIISPIEDWPGFRSSIISPWHPKVTFLHDHPYIEAVRYLVLSSSEFYFSVKRDAQAGLAVLTYPFVDSTLEYVVDERRGFLPIKVIKTSKSAQKVTVTVLYVEATHIKGFGWFPMRWTFVYSSDGEKNVVCSVTELRVTELTMGRPTPELLTMKVPQGRRFIDQTNLGKLKQLVMEKDTNVTIKDVPTLVDRYRNPSKYVESARRGPRLSLWPRVVLVVLGAVAVLGIAYIGYRRWRSARD